MGKLLDENSLRAIRTFVNTSIASAISAVYKPQGSSSVSGLNGLTKAAAMNGYVYNTTDSGNLTNQDSSTIHVNQGENVVFIWNNGSWYWDVLGSIIDLSTLVPKNNSAQALTGAIKVNVDANGLVIGSSALLASDIPDLSATYVTLATDQTINSDKTISQNKGIYFAQNGANKKAYITSSLIGGGILIKYEIDTPNNHNRIYISDDNIYIALQRRYDGITYDKVFLFSLYDTPSNPKRQLSLDRLTDGSNTITVAEMVAKYDKPSGGIPASDLAESYILSSAKGSANGVASLGSDGKVPTSQLPTSGGFTLLDVYPVGSIYISVNAISPEYLFGGEWERIEGQFLLGATGNTVSTETNIQKTANVGPGGQGGEASHQLIPNEMPKHRHKFECDAPGLGQFETWYIGLSQGGANPGQSSVTTPALNGRSNTIQVGETGGEDAHNNMPPFLAVYMWKRTA